MSPRTATASPDRRSRTARGCRGGLRGGLSTASDSSSGPVLVRRPGRATRARSSPSAVTSRTAKPRWPGARRPSGRGHGVLERRRRHRGPGGRESVVEEERGPRLPRLLLAAHHQLAGVRAAAPVHAAQVVTAAVLADRDVLGAAAGERARPVVAGAGPGAGERDRRQRAPAGVTTSGTVVLERAVQLDQAERVADAGPSSDRPRTARGRRSAPGTSTCASPAAGRSVDHEPRPGAERRTGSGPRAAAARSASGPRWSARAATRGRLAGRRPAAG